MVQKQLNFVEYAALVKKFFPKGLPFSMDVRIDHEKIVKDESLTYLKHQLECMKDGISKREKAQGKHLAKQLQKYIKRNKPPTKK